MAIYATNAKRVTDEMFIEAAHAVADQVRPGQLKLGMLFPPQSNILETEIQTAASGEAGLRFRARSRRASRGHGRVHPRTCQQARIFWGSNRRLKGGLGAR